MKHPFKHIKLLLLPLILFVISENIFSQQTQRYRTIKGDIAIIIRYNDSTLIARSNQLTAVLDYETSKMAFLVGYETFYTGIDSIDTKFKSLKGMKIEYSGKLDILINPQKHPPQKFNLTGIINSSSPMAAGGNGTLVHQPISGNNMPSCILTLTMKTSLSGLNLTTVFKTAEDTIQIEIRQSLLEKEIQY